MAIELGSQGVSHPNVRYRHPGQLLRGMVCHQFVRPRTKRQAPGYRGPAEQMTRPDGSLINELVLTVMVLPGTTVFVGNGERVNDRYPQQFELVRDVINGMTYSSWIEATRALGRSLQVGDVVERTFTNWSAPAAGNNPSAPRQIFTDEASAGAYNMQHGQNAAKDYTVAVRGPQGEEVQWVPAAEQHYGVLELANQQAQRQPTQFAPTAQQGYQPPVPGYGGPQQPVQPTPYQPPVPFQPHPVAPGAPGMPPPAQPTYPPAAAAAPVAPPYPAPQAGQFPAPGAPVAPPQPPQGQPAPFVPSQPVAAPGAPVAAPAQPGLPYQPPAATAPPQPGQPGFDPASLA